MSVTINGYIYNEINDPINWSNKEYTLLIAHGSKLPDAGKTITPTNRHSHAVLVAPDLSVDPVLSCDNNGDVSFYRHGFFSSNNKLKFGNVIGSESAFISFETSGNKFNIDSDFAIEIDANSGHVTIECNSANRIIHNGRVRTTHDLSGSSWIIDEHYAYGDDESPYLERHYYFAEGTTASPGWFEIGSDVGRVVYEELYNVYGGEPGAVSSGFKEAGKMEVQLAKNGFCYISSVDWVWSTEQISIASPTWQEIFRVGWNGITITGITDGLYNGAILNLHNISAEDTADSRTAVINFIGTEADDSEHTTALISAHHATADSDGDGYLRFATNSGASVNKYMYFNHEEKLSIGAVALTNEGDVMCLNSGVIALKETTTPTTDTNYGKLYCKNDDKLYFQDGVGCEHEIAYTP